MVGGGRLQLNVNFATVDGTNFGGKVVIEQCMYFFHIELPSVQL